MPGFEDDGTDHPVTKEYFDKQLGPDYAALSEKYMTRDEVEAAIKPALDAMQAQGARIAELERQGKIVEMMLYFILALIVALAIQTTIGAF